MLCSRQAQRQCWTQIKVGFPRFLKTEKKEREEPLCLPNVASLRGAGGCVCGVKIERKICKRLQNDDNDDNDKLPVLFGSVKCCVEGLLCGGKGVGSYWK